MDEQSNRYPPTPHLGNKSTKIKSKRQITEEVDDLFLWLIYIYLRPLKYIFYIMGFLKFSRSALHNGSCRRPLGREIN